ncbi:MAG: biopolymer transporter ExbD [Acidobacteria bacterium]|nr:biopolymer transporter ExbD [Acidobacteriota bacterium]
MLYRRKSKQTPSIDLSPMIDVVFLLLIFFMVSTTFKDSHGMDLALPEASAETNAKDETLRVQVGKDGQIRILGNPVEKSQFLADLEADLASRKEKMVVFEIDQSVEHGSVIELMDLAKQAGASGITFAAKAKKKEVP